VARSTTFKLNITVVNPGSGNKYYIDGILQSYITLFPGCTYEWNQDDSSNSGHPLRFSETSDGTHAGGSEYITRVTTSGTPGSATAWTKIEVTTSTPVRLYYYCTNHSGMGNQITCETTTKRTRGTQAGNYPSQTDRIIATDLASSGKFNDFGDLTSGRYACGAAGNSIRAFFAGGSPNGGSTKLNDINQIIVSSYGNAIDFGDLSVGRHYVQGTGNDTRAVWAGGSVGGDTIDYKEFASSGNATDFGDLASSKEEGVMYSSTTRGIYAGGSPGPSNVIEYITIASTGNGTDFGDLTVARSGLAGSSSATRGVQGGGTPAGSVNTIDYITISSTGNATDFGDLTQSRGNLVLGMSDKNICLFGGGRTPSTVNTIDFVTISSTGDAVDWGDLLETTAYNQSSTSNGHGGLS